MKCLCTRVAFAIRGEVSSSDAPLDFMRSKFQQIHMIQVMEVAAEMLFALRYLRFRCEYP
ncbi:MAG: hypothetical protein JWL61_3373 [Gemmatimonadetes bacterium]|nr:hypothetical protein [Gemmatimonadota bacterium]